MREGRYDISQLETSSAIIVIGHVTAVKRGADLNDTAFSIPTDVGAPRSPEAAPKR